MRAGCVFKSRFAHVGREEGREGGREEGREGEREREVDITERAQEVCKHEFLACTNHGGFRRAVLPSSF